DLAGMDITRQHSAPDHLTLHSPFKLQLEKLNAQPLHEQDWQLTGNISGQLPALHINSQLHSELGVVVNSAIELNHDTMQGNLSLAAVYFAYGNTLQETFEDSPKAIC